MDVQIPSPSVFLRNSPILNPAPVVQPKRTGIPKSKNTVPTAKPPAKTVQDGAVTKTKQSKSRNGCMTCKKKRLKCDEVKPSCGQCGKRNVECEGYKKDYKWRTFEETTFTARPVTKRKPLRSNSFIASQHGPQPVEIAGAARHLNSRHHVPDPSGIHPKTWSPGLPSHFQDAANHVVHNASRDTSVDSSPDLPGNLRVPNSQSPLHLTPESVFMPAFETEDLPNGMAFDHSGNPYSLTNTTTNSSMDETQSTESYESDSPRMLDLLLSGTENDHIFDPDLFHPPMTLGTGMNANEDFDEEIVRSDAMAASAPMPFLPLPNPPPEPNLSSTTFQDFRASSPTPSETSSTSSKGSGMTLLARPLLEASSPEMLMLRFDQQTCGILSVKDGPTENPWRTLIWPLARESPALYHAISSMTAFHGTHEIPDLHMPGMAHMTQAIKRLASEIENMRIDSALATCLALAFGEGWDRHISTGVQHLRGAKVMVNNAVVKHRRDMQSGQMTSQDANRLRFLCNTFVYMDVIARLTATEEAQDLNFEEVLSVVNTPTGDQVEIDPLMGCATTLFPIIGRVANLIQKVRKTKSNSLTVVSKAMELKEQLLQWQIPRTVVFERPEDPNSEVQHSVQTAEAYRWATLLYLHQAVPEIPSDPAHSLAKKVLVTLASVPTSSRTTIVQIFPLFAASCEITDAEDREWVIKRWVNMILRLKIGNVNSCWKVIEEVWSRRDEFENEKASQLLRQFDARGVPDGNFVRPSINMPPGLKRKHQTMDSVVPGDTCVQSQSQERPLAAPGAPAKSGHRRANTDTDAGRTLAGSPPMPSSRSLPRRHTGDIVAADQLEPEYTVRGHLHWLGVMAEWDWEVFLG